MKTPLKSFLASFGILALCSAAGARQPEMNGAIVQLEEAKHSHHPIEHLERAKHDLEDARHNKHGERVEAIHQVNEAIAAARRHHHKAMEAHINTAFTKCAKASTSPAGSRVRLRTGLTQNSSSCVWTLKDARLQFRPS